MMFYVTLLVFIFLFITNYCATRSLLHPSAITLLIWISLLLVYELFPHGLYPLSGMFYSALLLWVVPFCVFSCITSKLKIRNKCVLIKEIPSSYVKLNYYILLICLSVTIIGLFITVFTGFGTLLYDARQYMLQTFMHEGKMLLPSYLYMFERLSMIGFVYLLYLYMYEGGLSRRFCIIFVMLLIYFLLFASKTYFLQLGVGFLGLLYIRGFPVKRILFILISISLLIVLFEMTRNAQDASSDNVFSFLIIYFLSPMPAFDLLLSMNTDFTYYFEGEYVFSYFARLFSLVPNSDYLEYLGNSNYVYVPYPTNVFTVMEKYYLDYGMIGFLVFSSIHGIVWGILYKYSKFNDCYKVIYISLLYILVFQFFADFSSNIGLVVSVVLYGCFLFLPLLLKIKKNALY